MLFCLAVAPSSRQHCSSGLLCLLASAAFGQGCSQASSNLFSDRAPASGGVTAGVGSLGASGVSAAGAGAADSAPTGETGQAGSDAGISGADAANQTGAGGSAGPSGSGGGGASNGAPDGGGAHGVGDNGNTAGTGLGGLGGAAGQGGQANPHGGAPSSAGAGSGICDLCDAQHSQLASCSEQTGCLYSGCNSGYLNCDPSAPNVDGCSCQGNGCCGSRCQTAHDNGVGNTFYDCVAADTYNVEQAFEAAQAATAQAGTAAVASCGNAANLLLGVCKTTGVGSCACWSYQGTGVYASMVGKVTVQPNGCMCTTESQTAWH
jgi:hypothetical protein